MNLKNKLKEKNRVLCGWINDKQFLFNAVPLEDAIAILAEAQKLVNVDQRVSPKTAEEILPCPFCGSEAELIDDNEIHAGGFYIRCNNCNCKIGMDYDRDAMPNNDFATREDARNAWNKRIQ